MHWRKTMESYKLKGNGWESGAQVLLFACASATMVYKGKEVTINSESAFLDQLRVLLSKSSKMTE